MLHSVEQQSRFIPYKFVASDVGLSTADTVDAFWARIKLATFRAAFLRSFRDAFLVIFWAVAARGFSATCFGFLDGFRDALKAASWDRIAFSIYILVAQWEG